jgi:DNA polymerase-3 subunit delta
MRHKPVTAANRGGSLSGSEYRAERERFPSFAPDNTAWGPVSFGAMPAPKKSPPPDLSAPFHFVTGADEAEVKKTAADLAMKLAPSDDPFSVETIDGAVGTVDEAVDRVRSTIEALLTLPFFAGAKLVWLKNVSFLSDTVTGRSDTVIQEVDRLLEVFEKGLPDGVRFLLSAPEADKRRSAYRTLSKRGALHLRDKPDFGWGATEDDLINWVGRRAQTVGVLLSHEALEVLTARVGVESRQLDTELEKLSLAFGPGHELSASEVRELVPATRAGGIFDLSNAIARRDLPLCLQSLDQLLRQGERAIVILLAAIVPTVRNLLVVKDLLDQHRVQPPSRPTSFAGILNRLPAAATAHLPRKKDGAINAYPLGIAAVNARRFSLAELERAFLGCARANRDLVTTQLAEGVVLTRLVVELVGRPD